MAEIMVTSTADSGAGSLRQAIDDAADGDVILFDADVFPVGERLRFCFRRISRSAKAFQFTAALMTARAAIRQARRSGFTSIARLKELKQKPTSTTKHLRKMAKPFYLKTFV